MQRTREIADIPGKRPLVYGGRPLYDLIESRLSHSGFLMGGEGGQSPPHWLPPLEVQKPPLRRGETGVYIAGAERCISARRFCFHRARYLHLDRPIDRRADKAG
jgi:hypothetical protein